MRIRKTKAGRAVRFAPAGAITLGYGSGSLRRAVHRALRAGARRIEVDVSAVRYLDAAGLGELVACRAAAVGAGAEFSVSGLEGKARELFRLTGLDRVLTRQPGDEKVRVLRWRVA